MNYQHYIKESDQYMISLYSCMDSALAAEKMYSWDNLGEDNPAWSKGPYISAPSNSPQINRSHPYLLRISSSFSNLAAYLIGQHPNIEENGGVDMGNYNGKIEANVLIPTVTICMQFALLEAIDIQLFNRWADENNIDLSANPEKRYSRLPVRLRMEIMYALLLSHPKNVEC